MITVRTRQWIFRGDVVRGVIVERLAGVCAQNKSSTFLVQSCTEVSCQVGLISSASLAAVLQILSRTRYAAKRSVLKTQDEVELGDGRARLEFVDAWAIEVTRSTIRKQL
jgi:S-adenosylmethionine:diacylglycerol 3-amino-3-carboxypropyl transferase